MNIGPNSANYYSQYYPYVGEAPQLSSTYGQYDNGNYVFNYYWNFNGNFIHHTLQYVPFKFSCPSYQEYMFGIPPLFVVKYTLDPLLFISLNKLELFTRLVSSYYN